METPRQFAFDLGHPQALGREDFLVTDGNREAVGWLDRWPDWPSFSLVLHGPPGCGKSHLVRVFAQSRNAAAVNAAGLGTDDPPRLLSGRAVVAVEDCDRGVDETALFHLHNLARESGVGLLLTGRLPPAQWPLSLPDLRSRILSGPAVAIAPPDDALMAAVLVKLFADRQLRVGQEVIAYLLTRLERSFDAARRVVAAIDGLALSARRPVSVPLVAEVLRSFSPQENEKC